MLLGWLIVLWFSLHTLYTFVFCAVNTIPQSQQVPSLRYKIAPKYGHKIWEAGTGYPFLHIWKFLNWKLFSGMSTMTTSVILDFLRDIPEILKNFAALQRQENCEVLENGFL